MFSVVTTIILVLATVSYSYSEQSQRDRLKTNIFANLPEDDRVRDSARERLKNNPFLSEEDSSETQPQPEPPQRAPTVSYHVPNAEDERSAQRKRLEQNPFFQIDKPATPAPAPAPAPAPVHVPRPNVPFRRPGLRPVNDLGDADASTSYSPKTLLTKYDNVCGFTSSLSQAEKSVFHLLANGDTVTYHYPWLVAIYHLAKGNADFKCGGTLISSKHMISAAHCFPHEDTDIYQFVITNDLQKDRLVREAAEVILHPDYRPQTSDADIALAVFRSEVPLNWDIRPICLWLEGINDIRNVINVNGVVVGWGNDENNQKSKALPKEASLPIISYVDCIRDNSKFISVLGPKSFCAGYKNNTGPCPGDSGSGFVIQRMGRWYLRGVVSSTLLHDRNVCHITEYTAMTDVAKYSSWIINLVSR